MALNNQAIIEAFASEIKANREEAAIWFLRNWIPYFISRSERWRIDDASRKDVQQNTCLKVLLNAHKFRGTSEGQAVNWIRTIAEREFNSYHKKNFPKNAIPLEPNTDNSGVEGFELDTGVVDDAPREFLFEETVPNTDFSRYLNSSIERGELTPEEIRSARYDSRHELSRLRAQFGEYYLEMGFKEFSAVHPKYAVALVHKASGHNAKEIASALGLASAGAARVFVHTARKMLIDFLRYFLAHRHGY